MIDITTDDLWLPGDVLTGALLRGWCGPLPQGGVWDDSSGNADEWIDDDWRSGTRTGQRLDCNRREVRRNIVDVLMAGEQCPACEGEGDCTGQERADCQACEGTGYTRPPHDLTWVTVAELRYEITPVEAAGILWASVLRVDAGLGPARCMPAWRSCAVRDAVIRGDMICDGAESRVGRLGLSFNAGSGWYVVVDDQYIATGPETGDEGRAKADAAALSAAYALRDPGALLLPHPDGTPRRLEAGHG